MTLECLICSSSRTDRVGSVPVDDLVHAYRQPGLAVDVEHLFAKSSGAIELWHCGACDLRWYAPSVSGDAEFYAGLQRQSWYYQEDKPEYLHACQTARPGMKVLEVGCGSGAFASHLPKGVSFRGLEFNSAAVSRASAKGLDVEICPVESEANRAPQAYDLVCSFQVLEHVEDPAGFLAACVAALKPGGQLVIATPAEDSFLALVNGGWLNMPPHHLTRWTDAALVQAMNRAGTDVTEVWHEAVAPYHHDWYQSVMATHGLRSLTGLKPSLSGRRVFHALAWRLLRVPAMRRAMVRRGEARFSFAGRGHTVCVSAVKRGH